MLGKPLSGKGNAPGGGGGDHGDARFLHDLETLSKALSLDPKNRRRRALPSSSSGDRVLSAGRSRLVPDPKLKSKKSSSSSSSSSSFWKSLKSLSHIGQRRHDCLFSLHVHSIEGLPPALASAALTVHWRRSADPAVAASATRAVHAFHGVVEFDETLTYRSSVYTRGGGSHQTGGAVKYEPRQFTIYATVASSPTLDLGKHHVDLSRLLPLSIADLEADGDEQEIGKWRTSFRLSGKARGAKLSVSFGFSLVKEKKISEILNVKPDGRVDRQGSLSRILDRTRSVEDVKVLHEVLPSSKSDASVLANIDRKSECDDKEDDSKAELKACKSQEQVEANVESPESKHCTSSVPVKGGNLENDCAEAEFSVIEQGIEIAPKDQEEVNPGTVDNVVVNKEEVGVKIDEPVKEDSCADPELEKRSLLAAEPVIEDLESVFHSLSVLEPEEFESPKIEDNLSKHVSYADTKSSYKSANSKSKSCSLDAEYVASEFLNMLGIEHSPFGVSSESDPESPRERLWKQFEKESLASGSGIFGLDYGGEMEEPNFGDFAEDFDLSSIVHEVEVELQKESQELNSMTRAKLLEDAETEALMREWGLNEKAFQCSPPGSRSGFGSPINLPPEEPLELLPLGEGLGPFVQTKDGGFLRSMNPSLFRNAKNDGSLVMQVSSPIVVPAEMGSGIMDILQRLASVGIEKLSMQASKLMPLEEITGKTVQQIAWDAAPALESCERQDLLQHHISDALAEFNHNGSGKRRKGKGLDLASSSGREPASEYVSLDDLAPLAMDKIEALSIEGLRIQSGMSNEEAPSNITAQSIGEISALEGRGAKNNWSLGLEGTAGLQLLDVKDNGDDVDGLMGLSITLDEWMRLDSGIVDEEDQFSDRTSKILAAHHANSMDLNSESWKGEKRGGKKSGRRWGMLGNNFTVALMVQLRDPLRNYEPVGTPMLSLIQVERVFIPPKPKIYGTVSEKGNSEQNEESETETKPLVKEEKNEEEDAIPQFKITEVHVAGLKSEPGKKKLWGNPVQQQAGSRWLLASGMGKSNKHPFMKSKAVTKSSQATTTTTVLPGETLWSISSRVHGTGSKWKDLAALNPHIRNPNVIFPNETIRLR
ncbi:protein PLASTID MOVEMENT IMPAIRED 1-RELATED 1 [Typha latifolia]|uniref:protein PLASTID MOVEMENT IMPAIRED 1-RELATED 1 n=1 Tax=Typha latifolia TaxID=4733 RepID=UPI003C2E1959